MAKISNEDRHQYFEKIKPYKAMIQSLLKREETVLQVIKRDSRGAAFKRLTLADEMIFLASNYIVIGGVSQSMLKLRNEEALNDGRKSLYKAVIYLEEVVSPLVDAPYSDYEGQVAEIAPVDARRRYGLIRKMGLALQLLENAYGDNTKWKWAFVELEGRFAAVAKNIIDLKMAVVNTDPRSPDYEPTIYHLRLIKKLLHQAADRYREKYELSTNRIDDFKMGIHFLNALRRIHILFGERADADTLKKKADIWNTKLEMDLKKQEETVLKRT
ncbi:MAG: hypothetical protein FWC45_02925 [Treponema sp.]|nr:hypothetical protein [Treponema sp.]